MIQLQPLECVQGVAFAVNLTGHLNNLHGMSQGRDKVVMQFYDYMRAFKTILTL